MKIKAGIIGASGYTGAELLRLLANHPHFDVTVATAESQAGQEVSTLYPHLSTYKGQKLVKKEEAASDLAEAELIFCALPHGEAMNVLPSLKNKVVIDLGGDFRLDRADDYEKWYKHKHTAPSLLQEWQYGLTELFRPEIKKSGRIANPGCYPTACTLPIAPLVKEGLVEGPVIISAMSGTSGAGRVPSPGMHFSHAFEDFKAYKVAEHQHTPEIEMAIKLFSGKEILVSFTPHLVPMVRGINATCVVATKERVGVEELYACLKQTYENERFVTVQKTGGGTKEVRGSNRSVISVFHDKRLGRAIITCVIDNLVKGASGQALQNANLILGFDESTGLEMEGMYP